MSEVSVHLLLTNTALRIRISKGFAVNAHVSISINVIDVSEVCGFFSTISHRSGQHSNTSIEEAASTPLVDSHAYMHALRQ